MRLGFVSCVAGLAALCAALSPQPVAANSQWVHGLQSLNTAQPLVVKTGSYGCRRTYRARRGCCSYGGTYGAHYGTYYAYPHVTYDTGYGSYYRAGRGYSYGHAVVVAPPVREQYYSPHDGYAHDYRAYQEPQHYRPFK